MTFYENGLIRAMKSAFRKDGYTVAATESGYIILGENWGVSIHSKAMPNTVKSLIVLHAGKLPEENKAIQVKKGEILSCFYEMAVDRIDDLDTHYRKALRSRIFPTRLIMDGCRLWQLTDSLAIKRVDPEDEQILDYMDNDAYLVRGMLYGTTVYGSVFVACENAVEEDKGLMAHLEQMQWIPVEVCDAG